MSAPTLPPAVVITFWNRVAEDTGSLDTTICKFADLLLSEFIAQQNAVGSTSQRRYTQ